MRVYAATGPTRPQGLSRPRPKRRRPKRRRRQAGRRRRPRPSRRRPRRSEARPRRRRRPKRRRGRSGAEASEPRRRQAEAERRPTEAETEAAEAEAEAEESSAAKAEAEAEESSAAKAEANNNKTTTAAADAAGVAEAEPVAAAVSEAPSMPSVTFDGQGAFRLVASTIVDRAAAIEAKRPLLVHDYEGTADGRALRALRVSADATGDTIELSGRRLHVNASNGSIRIDGTNEYLSVICRRGDPSGDDPSGDDHDHPSSGQPSEYYHAASLDPTAAFDGAFVIPTHRERCFVLLDQVSSDAKVSDSGDRYLEAYNEMKHKDAYVNRMFNNDANTYGAVINALLSWSNEGMSLMSIRSMHRRSGRERLAAGADHRPVDPLVLAQAAALPGRVDRGAWYVAVPEGMAHYDNNALRRLTRLFRSYERLTESTRTGGKVGSSPLRRTGCPTPRTSAREQFRARSG